MLYSQHEGRQAKSDTHRTDYEEAGGPVVFQWLPGIKSDTVRLDKAGVQPEGGWRVFGYFLHEQKVPRPWVREPTRQRAPSGPLGSSGSPGAHSPH